MGYVNSHVSGVQKMMPYGPCLILKLSIPHARLQYPLCDPIKSNRLTKNCTFDLFIFRLDQIRFGQKMSKQNGVDILNLQVKGIPKCPRSKKSQGRFLRNRALKIASYVCSREIEKSDFFRKSPKTAIQRRFLAKYNFNEKFEHLILHGIGTFRG